MLSTYDLLNSKDLQKKTMKKLDNLSERLPHLTTNKKKQKLMREY